MVHDKLSVHSILRTVVRRQNQSRHMTRRGGGRGGCLLLFRDAVAKQLECYALTNIMLDCNIIRVSLIFFIETYGVVVSF